MGINVPNVGIKCSQRGNYGWLSDKLELIDYLISSNSPVSESMMKPRTTMSLGTSG